MEEFEEGKEQDVIDILYDYDEDSRNIISKETIWALVGFVALFCSQWFLAGYIYGTGICLGIILVSKSLCIKK